ncbi:MAG: membrane dipeptidase [Chlamydiales bacterium]
MRIADLHCDLLSYLADNKERTPNEPKCRCSFPQLKKGNVAIQVLAIFTQTGENGIEAAKKQLALFQTLPKSYPSDCRHLKDLPSSPEEGKVSFLAAIENLSGLCDETESLENGLFRLVQYQEQANPILYVSLTWHEENRFGGGDRSKAGLKRDGEIVLDYLNETAIAIDLSHTSDALAEDILNYIDKKGLNLTPIASHSNFRSICHHPRNLPDPFAKEIVNRGGVIGFNFVKPFVGQKSPEDFMRHVDHAHKLGVQNHYCFGADFFFEDDFPHSSPAFYDRFGNAGCYQELINYLSTAYSLSELEKLAYKNLNNFLTRQIL